MSSEICKKDALETIFQRSPEEMVFSNHLLVKKILTNLVINRDRKTSQQMIQTIRLVQKSWLETTTSVLKKSVKPVIVLNLNVTNSLAESDEVRKHGKLLDQFVSLFGATHRLKESLLPFKLNLTLEYFRSQNQLSLSNCLTRLGKEMIELHVTFPRNGGTMPLIFPRFKLPFLRKLSFQFAQKGFERRPGDEFTYTFGGNRNGLGLLQLLLNVSENITDLNIPWSGIGTMNSDTVPVHFEFLQLPISISSIEFTLLLRSQHLELLLRNELPKLKHLAIKHHFNPPGDDFIFKILHGFRKTLTSLRFEGLRVRTHPNNRTICKFPIMEKLEKIKIIGSWSDLDPQNCEILQTFLPKLRHISFIHYTEALLQKWIQNSKFDKVDALVLGLASDQFGREHPDPFQSLSLEVMNQVYITFPNITQLTVSFNISNMSSLQCVFENMGQLKVCTILLAGNFLVTKKYHLDSILLGIPVNLVTALTEHSNLLRSVELELKGQNSIVGLSELTCLTLWRTKLPFLDAPGPVEMDEMSCISDLLFTKGFSKMPKLKILGLVGNIQASPKMVELWQGKGRVIKHRVS